MIATLTGTVAEKTYDLLVLNVGGVGYGLQVTSEDFGRLIVGETAKLYVHEHIREQNYDLFGFLQLETQKLFRQLLDVKNVGPKVALAVLDIRSSSTVRAAIAAGDVKLLQTAKGVGKRAAEQIVVELRDKVGMVAGDAAEGIVSRPGIDARDEAAEALVALGYSPQDAMLALQAIDATLSVEDRVKRALRGGPMIVSGVTLSNGNVIPQVGLGLWKVTKTADFNRSVEAAVQAGYRHFDTAQAYGNEQLLPLVLKRVGLERNDVWITTKIEVKNFGYRKTHAAFDESLRKLKTSYVDLLLLHFPVPLLRRKSWQALEEIKAAGRAKSIGVSNYTIRHLEEMKQYAREMPVVNQVELHVFLQQPELLDYCRENHVAVEAYSPLAHGKAMNELGVAAIAAKHHKSYAQIMLRWCIERGLIVIPKSVTLERVKENIAIFDFKLDSDDMQYLRALDRNMRTCWSPVHVP